VAAYKTVLEAASAVGINLEMRKHTMKLLVIFVRESVCIPPGCTESESAGEEAASKFFWSCLAKRMFASLERPIECAKRDVVRREGARAHHSG